MRQKAKSTICARGAARGVGLVVEDNETGEDVTRVLLA